MSNETAKDIKRREPTPIERLKNLIGTDSVQQQFKNALAENSGPFVASIIDLFVSDYYLQECDPNKVIMEALKAATLKLPINKQLGFAYVVPYNKVPQFQIGYKGYIQLAMRSGQYKCLNAGVVYEGVNVQRNLLTGEVSFAGEPTSEKPKGYFTYIEMLNGFSKTLYMNAAEMLAHAKKYSKSFKFAGSAWQTNFDSMAMKTTTRLLLSKYGFLSTDMMTALTTESRDDSDFEEEVSENANKTVIDVTATMQDMGPAEDQPEQQPVPDITPPAQEELKATGTDGPDY